MKRKELSLRRRTRISQKMPQDSEEMMMTLPYFLIKMCQRNLHEHGQMENMDKVPLCFYIPPDRTVNKTGKKRAQVKMSGRHLTVVQSCCDNQWLSLGGKQWPKSACQQVSPCERMRLDGGEERDRLD